MKQTHLAICIFSLFVFASCTKDVKQTEDLIAESAQENFFEKSNIQPGSFVPGELIVKFKKGKSLTSKQNAFARIGGTSVERIITNAMKNVGDDEGFYLVKSSMEVKDALNVMRQVDEIEYAEPNFIYTHDAVSNDTHFSNGNLWGMYGANTSPSNQFGSHAAVAWAKGKIGSAAVYIGVIDEGAMHNHTDLEGNFGNPGEIAGDGVDNDGNGKIDDVFGWDFVSNDNSTYDGTADDHGTHVAGTIGAKGGNGTGVAGVCWSVKMISGKFLGANGGTTANAIKAVDYFTDFKVNRGVNIVATNNSWGGGGYSQALYDAIDRANSAGILFIAAAGNGNIVGKGYDIDKQKSYPASYTNTNIIAVAAITSTGSIAGYSNFGIKSVHLGAPGSAVVSTIPDNKYGSYSGTSMATPHVTGAVALYASINPNATAAEIKQEILNSTTKTSSLNRKTATGGRLNVSTF